MKIELTKTQKKNKEKYELFIRDKLYPLTLNEKMEKEKYDKIIDLIRKKSFFGLNCENKYGGNKVDEISFGLFCEAIGRASASVLSLITVHSMAIGAIERWGTEEQKKNLLPKLSKGEYLGALALTEPEAGSDARSIKTVIEDSGNKVILNGYKRWISMAQKADIFIVLGRHNEEHTAVIVPTKTSGLKIEKIDNLLGFRNAYIGGLEFNNCIIDSKNILGRKGFGFTHVFGTALDIGRYCIAAGCTGLSEACLNACLDYTNKRSQFGKKLRIQQLVQEMIANMEVNLQASRLMYQKAGYERQEKNPEYIMSTSIAKYFASKSVMEIANNAVQLHGANGCSSDYPVERYFRDAKIMEIIEGSSQMQQIMIAKYGYQKHLYNI